VTFRWTEVEDALEYRVHLSGPGGAAGSHAASGPSWTLAPESVEPGQRWTWSVEAVTPDGAVRSEDVAFEIASADQLAELDHLKGRLAPLFDSKDRTREDTAAYLLGTYCRSTGFYDEAIAQVETLVARHPERKELHRELGALYQAVGRNDRAAEEYRLALED
jgi:tetratricopeptide (TPR) repeat protein